MARRRRLASALASLDLATKVEFLRRPASYPEPTGSVDVVETHMAWVFLTATHAYKLKKPVRFEYLDFSTPMARRRMCEEEVRLNRRLAPLVYLAAVPLSVSAEGRLVIGPGDRVVDWLVKMRRLPARFMLDAWIERGDPPLDRLEALGETLARFYQEAEPVPTSPTTYLHAIRAQVEQSREVARHYHLPEALIEAAFGPQDALLAGRPDLLGQRALAGRIVEGHGDLRPEHVCLLPVPLVIDCIEFNRDFRVLDPLDDLAFLLLETRRLGAPDAGLAVLSGYRRRSGDHPPELLLRFYEAFRAGVRAKIALWHLRDVGAEQPDRWIERAERYLTLATELLPSPWSGVR